MLGKTVKMVVAMQGHCKRDRATKVKERGVTEGRAVATALSGDGKRGQQMLKLNEGCPGHLGSWREVTSQRGDRH